MLPSESLFQNFILGHFPALQTFGATTCAITAGPTSLAILLAVVITRVNIWTRGRIVGFPVSTASGVFQAYNNQKQKVPSEPVAART